MMRIAQFSLEEINPRIGLGMPKFTVQTDIGSFKVRASSDRLECLKRNHTCVRCRRKGNLWMLECSVQKQPVVGMNCFVDNCPWCAMRRPFGFKRQAGKWDTPHLNLYHRSKKGQLILMTQDHIVPKHAGGSNSIDNLQTMCRECNSYKGGMLPHEYAKVMLPHERIGHPGRVDGRGVEPRGLPPVYAPLFDEEAAPSCAA